MKQSAGTILMLILGGLEMALLAVCGLIVCLSGLGLVFIVSRGIAHRRVVAGPGQGFSYPEFNVWMCLLYGGQSAVLVAALAVGLTFAPRFIEPLATLVPVVIVIIWGIPAVYFLALPIRAWKSSRSG